MSYRVPETVPAWHVEIYWYSTIAGHLTGWLRTEDQKQERRFSRQSEASQYASDKTGVPSILISYMHRKGVVTQTTRKTNWYDKLRAILGLTPLWELP